MDPLTVLFSLTCIGVGGGVGYWLKKADDKNPKQQIIHISTVKLVLCKTRLEMY